MVQFPREIISARIAAYEIKHDVASYRIRGISAWPLVRIISALALHAGVLKPSSKVNKQPVVSNLQQGFIQTCLVHARHIYTYRQQEFKVGLQRCKLSLFDSLSQPFKQISSGDVLIVSNENRRILWGEDQYNTVIDPLRELLIEKGIRPLVWEREITGDRGVAFPSWHAEMQKFSSGVIPVKFAKKLPEPNWFNDIHGWVAEDFKVNLTWDYVESHLRKILYFKHIVKPWIKKTKCKLLITDCWYNIDCLAFLLAVTELKLTILDFQHGLQGKGHFAYQAWGKVPSDGYDYLPRKFWVWDMDDAKNLVAGGIQNVKLDDIIIGGNLWLQKWKNSNDAVIHKNLKEARKLSKAWSHVILVTLQKGIDNLDLIKNAVKKSPEQWLWLIRVHRNDQQNIDVFEKYFKEIGHAGVNLREAVNFPLYTLFQIADIHVTGFSTCALEALEFDVPSIIVHESGQTIFKKHIMRGSMSYAANSIELIESAKTLIEKLPVDSFEIRSKAPALPNKPEESIDTLINDLICYRKKQPPT